MIFFHQSCLIEADGLLSIYQFKWLTSLQQTCSMTVNSTYICNYYEVYQVSLKGKAYFKIGNTKQYNCIVYSKCFNFKRVAKNIIMHPIKS